ncbi:conserved exported hypothetical protein [Candidatus Desulfosporosinus infrequens]|uniref:Uncharacterized protein n=1 Tax=Candidatus Desulfosporosinus infrequens TaxID=2043169 RepID=A0A2U3LRC2_9FIRM|nr:conserved exported hypothetical protein [Candidatus Desulfosporosinus infrequens]
MRKIFITFMILAAIAGSLISPLSVAAADANHYELIGWIADGTGISFTYESSLGKTYDGLACADLMFPHSKDTTWMGPDSVAPILAYIQKFGITSEVKRCMNSTCYDPTIFQAISAQGVNLEVLGGPDVAPGSTPPANLLGKANMKTLTATTPVVGFGIPTPDLSGLLNHATPPAVSNPTPGPTPAQSQQPSASTPTPAPNAPIPHESTQKSDTTQSQPQVQAPVQSVIPKTNTEVTPKETPKGPVVPPDLQSNTQSTSNKAPWKTWFYAGIAVIFALGVCIFGFIKWKQRGEELRS